MNLRTTCQFCGKTFTPYHRRQTTCSRKECQKQRARERHLERIATLSESPDYTAFVEKKREYMRPYNEANKKHWSDYGNAKKKAMRARGDTYGAGT